MTFRPFFRPGTPWIALLILLSTGAFAQNAQMLQSQHYRIYFAKEHEQVAGEILRISEAVWPTLARAYDAYGDYQIIDIFLSDRGDVANGSAIYPFSRVEIYLPHMNWVMRGRRNWLGNVVVHELAHVFSLRQKARLTPFSHAMLGGYTFNRRINYGLTLPWIPVAAPNWWIEGIAQLEAEEAGFDTWDSQRDMIVRDAWLTGTLPTLGEIETFDGDWVQAERVYNTGYAFLRWLRDRDGIDAVRELAFPKPLFHFGRAVEEAFGRPLSALYAEWTHYLAETYGDFEQLPEDVPADADMKGSYVQSLAFSRDGRYMAWLGNDDRRFPLNWIHWKEVGGPEEGRSAEPVTDYPAEGGDSPPRSAPGLASPAPDFRFPAGAHPALRPRFSLPEPAVAHDPLHLPGGRSREFGSAGLEFNHDGTRLLTTRNAWGSPYSDIWEYAFRARVPEREKWRRLTWHERASDAAYHPTESGTIVYARFERGSSNVAVMDASGRIRQLTRFTNGEQVYTPRYNPAADSIYFVLGRHGREAIAAVAADVPAWDPFAALEDSATFPDSLHVAAGHSVRLVTPLEEASYRDLRFTGDTLLFSTDGRDGVYNAFALPPGDTLYRMTRNRTQALEPQLHAGQLYYQGYRNQRFGIFRGPAELTPEAPWQGTADTLAPLHPKRLEYSKAAQSREPRVKKVAWNLAPYLSVSPQFLDDTTFADLNVDIGLQVALGPVSGGLSQFFGGYMSKKVDASTQLDYGLSYGGQWSGVTAWHHRYGWTPNLFYVASRDVRHQAFGFTLRDTVTDGVDLYDASIRVDDRIKYTYDVLQGETMLPLNGLRLGGGFLGTWWQARYWNQNVVFDESVTERYRNQSTGQELVFPYSYRVLETSLHRHLFQRATLQWYRPAFGTALPQYFGFQASLAQWWTRYADEPIPTDSIPGGFAQALWQDRPVPAFQYTKADFAPWQMDFGGFGAWSHGERVTLSLQHQTGFFTHKFPVVRDSIAVSQASRTEAASLHPNLWVMPYRLAFFMPGYPYSFQYRGRDILQGTAMTWTRVQADFPLKVRSYLEPPSPFSSLNKLQLSLIGNAGTVLNRTPDNLPGALSRGEHYLLMDYGARVSATFMFYHRIPMDLYAMVFKPWNQLREENVYLQEWAGRGYATPGDYLENVRQARFFVGFTLGGF